MLEYNIHGGYFGTSLNYVVGYQKNNYEYILTLEPFFGVPTYPFNPPPPGSIGFSSFFPRKTTNMIQNPSNPDFLVGGGRRKRSKSGPTHTHTQTHTLTHTHTLTLTYTITHSISIYTSDDREQ